MQIFYKFFYQFQYSKNVRTLPFYLARECGIKKNYSASEIDKALRKYGYNLRYSPIAYALYGHEGQYCIISDKWKPYPNRKYIRELVSKRYSIHDADINICGLLHFSLYKLSENGNSVKEYYKYLEKCRLTIKN